MSTGDLLRNEVKAGSTIGREVDAVMRSGGLVPLSVTLTLVDNAFRASSCKHFLIDGFPRSLEQAHAFEKKVCYLPLRLILCEIKTQLRL